MMAPRPIQRSTTVVRADGTMSREEWRAAPNAPIDCFYAYPTVSTDPGMNSDMTPNEAELRVVHQQLARFASVCRVYAPSYRQVTLAGLRERRAGGATNLSQGLAYDDVRSAFHHYLEDDNAGRGFVLIGHSQGSYVLTSLVAQEIDGKPLQDRMVSALLLGATVPVARGQVVGGAFQRVPLCCSTTQTGCVVAYSAFRSTAPPPGGTLFGRVADPSMAAACTNPAALEGGSGELHAYLSGPGFTIVSGRGGGSAWTSSSAQVTTPFVSVPGLLTARCTSNEFATYLEITVHGDPADPRVDDIRGDLTPPWGLHLVDANLAMGNLVDLVRTQSASWRSSR
ncbi:MAG: DUF3089 domain-containing protein [Gemmatimonadetes bacterium]|nr:DUF3089 domain-containing protein [Gemmatimonadota bacterium]